MKGEWKDYFSFNKKQRNGITVIVLFIALLLVYIFMADYFPPTTKPIDFSSFKAELKNAGIKSSAINTKENASTSQIDINSADTNVLMTLPKMTSYCAAMVVRYRKKLGGYYSTKQLTEVWGMDSTMFKAMLNKVRTDSGLVNKININTADEKQLAYHPYIKYYLAKAIVNYREEHGLFASLSALHKMAAIDDSTYSRIVPYLTVGNK
jgi:DNA uptake protein ComE-like DNA-binding protein